MVQADADQLPSQFNVKLSVLKWSDLKGKSEGVRHPKSVSPTGDSGLARVRGQVKISYSAVEVVAVPWVQMLPPYQYRDVALVLARRGVDR